MRKARLRHRLRALLPLWFLACAQCETSPSVVPFDHARRNGADHAASAPPPSPLPLPDDLPTGGPFRLAQRPEVSGTTGDGGSAAPSPTRLRPGQTLEADALKERELPGIRLEGEWRHPEPSPRGEVHTSGLDKIRKLTALKWTIDLAEAGRMRVRFVSRAFALPHGSELRARADRYGHILVWPDGSRYRVLPPGTLRTLLGEGRADSTPLGTGRVGEAGAGTRRFGLRTQRTEHATRTGSVTLDVAKVPEAGEAGALLCRLLLELVAIDPAAATCVPGEVPLRAQYIWPGGGGVAFEVTALQHRPDMPASLLTMPPASASAATSGLPEGLAILLTDEELSSLRSRGGDALPPSPERTNRGLYAFNDSDLPRQLLVDSIPVAWVAPWREVHLSSLADGRYAVAWRSMLGEVLEPATVIQLPARVKTGGAEPLSPP